MTLQLFRELRESLRLFFLRRVSDPDVANDLTQESFLRFEKAGYGVAALNDHKQVLFKISSNLLVDHRRSLGRAQRLGLTPAQSIDPETLEQVPSAEQSPEMQVMHQEQLDRVHAVIEELPQKCREVFLLHRLEGLKHREIAQRLNISKSMVEKHIAEAMLRISAVL